MNCKPGDLAVIVGGDMPEDLPIIGKVVQLTKIDPNWSSPVWMYEGSALRDANGHLITGLGDRYLRPIRPGSITDEEVRDLYAPKPPEVA